jgi:hypothetical protein
MLVDHGVVKLVCNVIASEESHEIIEEASLVGIACLLGGNRKT